MSWTSHAACAIAIAGVWHLVTGNVTAARSSEWAQHFSNASRSNVILNFNDWIRLSSCYVYNKDRRQSVAPTFVNDYPPFWPVTSSALESLIHGRLSFWRPDMFRRANMPLWTCDPQHIGIDHSLMVWLWPLTVYIIGLKGRPPHHSNGAFTHTLRWDGMGCARNWMYLMEAFIHGVNQPISVHRVCERTVKAMHWANGAFPCSFHCKFMQLVT